MEWIERIQALDKDEAQAKHLEEVETIIQLWRWFLLEADRVYKSFPKTDDSWQRHKGHRQTAETHCIVGGIALAQVELEKALEELHGIAMMQQTLL